MPPSDSPLSEPRRRALRRRLLEWYRKHRRDLPWRRTRDPYRILVSETMLQQTRVETVVPYYERFTTRFPSVSALADADEQEVLREWSGLGYYARARNLRRAAQAIEREHQGELPRDPAALRALPGVGRYTAGAVASIAFDAPEAIVDGNVKRVVARLLAAPALEVEAYWQVAGALVRGEAPGELNQALMELGAVVCTPRAPRCPTCPLRALCAGRDDPELYPRKQPRRAPRSVRAVAGLLVRRDGRVLLWRRPSDGLLGGLWELPSVESSDAESLVPALRERTGLVVRTGAKLGSVRHAFTHRALELELFRLETSRGRLSQKSDDARFCDALSLADLPLSRLTRKLLAEGGIEVATLPR